MEDQLDVQFLFYFNSYVLNMFLKLIHYIHHQELATMQASACNTNTTQTQLHQISNTQRNKNKTTNTVIQQHSRKLLTMAVLMSETC